MSTDFAEQMSRAFAFGRFVLVPARQLLLADGIPVRVGGRALDMLTLLVTHAGTIVSKRDMLARVWPSTVVEEANVKVNMAALRRVLGDEPHEARFIATVSRRGYRFVAPVRTCVADDLALESAVTRERARHNLPTVAGRLVGRDEVMALNLDEVATARLVSIMGADGVGKAAVAVNVVERAEAPPPEGNCAVDSTSGTSSEHPTSALDSAPCLSETAKGVEMLRDFLGSRRLLLVLDFA